MYISKRNTSNGILPIGSNLFGTCSTAAGTVAKVVTMSDFDVLVEGVTIHVYFSNGNTASSPTLRVGSTTAKNIRYNGANGGNWESGSIVSFTYYNNYWIQNDIQNVSSSAVSEIISSGTGTINGFPYYWENYSNGTKKSWITVTGTTAISTSGGGGYVSDMKSINISGLGLNTIHSIQAQFSYGYHAGSMHIYSHDTSQISWYFWCGASVTSRAYTVWIEIVGS